ncbi:hypothetical protein [Qipengyuania soli]|uniref:Uncharacterized protein n=1 Tax=Qipengyuania soli TaxID=2782568 RepID=A0A7S8IUX5_9SPHN|nr:hypothetical protein [Qipengyuania soli]QPC98251.1 hypothetical protein IRL76_10310 [Qipengyuania soli]
MKKFALPALAAALSLAACDSADAPATDDTAATTEAGDTTVITPTATETVVADPGTSATVNTTDGTSVTVDGKDVDATVSEDGVQAKINVD